MTSGGPGATVRRELHLHVGLPKTGTTYLQQCLLLNRDWFAARGIEMAPGQNAEGAHHRLAGPVRDAGPETLEDRLAELADTLGRAPGRRLLASSEMFSDLLARPGAAAALQRALAPRFDVTIYIVLRRQDFIKESAYAQVAKVMRRLGPLRAEPDPAIAARMLLHDNPDLDGRLRLIEDAFGPEALRVAVYHDRLRRDPLAQFCRMMGLDEVPDRRPGADANVSPPRRANLFLACFRKDDHRIARLILGAAATGGRLAADGPKFLLSPAERRQVVARYLEGNRRIVERYAPEDGDWLLELPPDDPGWFPPAPIRTADYLAMAPTLIGAALRQPRRRLPGRLLDAARVARLTLDAALWARRNRPS